MTNKPAESEETGLGVQTPWGGINAYVKSAWLKTVDRLGASKHHAAIAEAEGQAALVRARTQVATKLIEALGNLGVDRMKSDPEFAERVAEGLFVDIPQLRRPPGKQANVDSVLELSIEDLRNGGQMQPNTEGPSSEFLDRFERYAEDASSDMLRERWGKVLAQEILKPGSFDRKVMRIIDEISVTDASKFEEICKKSHIGGTILVSLLLTENDMAALDNLIQADLIHDAGLGRTIMFQTKTSSSGQERWSIAYENDGMLADISDASLIKSLPFGDDLSFNDGKLRIAVEALTDSGKAIASIIDEDRTATFSRLVEALRSKYPAHKFEQITRKEDGWHVVET